MKVILNYNPFTFINGMNYQNRIGGISSTITKKHVVLEVKKVDQQIIIDGTKIMNSKC